LLKFKPGDLSAGRGIFHTKRATEQQLLC